MCFTKERVCCSTCYNARLYLCIGLTTVLQQNSECLGRPYICLGREIGAIKNIIYTIRWHWYEAGLKTPTHFGGKAIDKAFELFMNSCVTVNDSYVHSIECVTPNECTEYWQSDNRGYDISNLVFV